MSVDAMFWAGFAVFIPTMLALDLGVFHRHAHEVRAKESLVWTAAWITLAAGFNALVYFWKGREAALQFLAGYLLEYSLSVDNIFVFLLIFGSFAVPAKHQHKVLFWGILGALALRALFIWAGIGLIHRFHWMIYVFGGFLIFTGVKMAFEKDKEVDPDRNPVLRVFRKFFQVARDCTPQESGRFRVRRSGRWIATPLLVVLIMVETTDVIFAVDSIPAILAVTTDPFIVYTSNAFAILGLRSLYFALSAVMRLFHHLHYGLSAILCFVGLKMLISEHYEIPIGFSLGVIALFLAVSITASVLWPKKDPGACGAA